MKEHSTQVVRTVDVIGKAVIGTDKEKLGKIEELVLDKVSGEVRYTVLSSGGLMGIGSDYYAIPWSELNYCPEEEAFGLPLSKDTLKNAPGFNKDSWPDFANPIWNKSVDDYYRASNYNIRDNQFTPRV